MSRGAVHFTGTNFATRRRLRWDILDRMRKLIENGTYKRPRWMDWVERFPPLDTRNLLFTDKTIKNPYPPLIVDLLKKYPNLRFQDCYNPENNWQKGFDEYSFDHPVMQFVSYQLSLMNKGVSKEEAFSRTEKVFYDKRIELEKRQKIAMALGLDEDAKPLYTTGKAYIQELGGESTGSLDFRRGIILSELHTPCCPLVCRLILPDPLTITEIAKIQQRLFLCIQYRSVLPCLPILEEYARLNSQTSEASDYNQTGDSSSESKKDGKRAFEKGCGSRKFVDYEGAITLLSFNQFFDSEPKIEDGQFAFQADSTKFLLNEERAKRIVELIKPSISTIPTILLKYSEKDRWSSRKRLRLNPFYRSYCEALSPSSRFTNLAKPYHETVEEECEDGEFRAIEFLGLGFGEKLSERRDVVRGKMRRDKLRIVQLKNGTPLEILHGVLLGFDVVVSPFPELLASDGKALIFKFPQTLQDKVEPVKLSEELVNETFNKLDEFCGFEEGEYRDKINEVIDLKEKRYTQDVDVLLHPESIRKESRGYIKHLLDSKEMSANIILSAHNLWMYETLFLRIREAIENNTLIQFIHKFIEINL